MVPFGDGGKKWPKEEMMNFYIAQFLGILVIIANVLAMQMKNKKHRKDFKNE